jgi:hypothetical protein
MLIRAKTKNYVAVGWRPANMAKTCKRFFLDPAKDAAKFAPKGRFFTYIRHLSADTINLKLCSLSTKRNKISHF